MFLSSVFFCDMGKITPKNAGMVFGGLFWK